MSFFLKIERMALLYVASRVRRYLAFLSSSRKLWIICARTRFIDIKEPKTTTKVKNKAAPILLVES